MAPWTRRVGMMSLALAAGFAPRLQAQSVWLPGSDPVTIGRSGVGIAFGRSLEAAGKNPALLTTLEGAGQFHLGAGMEMSSHPTTQLANTQVKFTSDRNRSLPTAGFAWKLGKDFSLGFLVDTPFLRHGQVENNATLRFSGTGVDLSSRRLQLQGAYAVSDALSIGIGVSGVQVRETLETVARYGVKNPNGAPTDPVVALAEVGLTQKGTKNLTSFNLGVRYAWSPRLTFAFTHDTGVKGTLDVDHLGTTGLKSVWDIYGSGNAPNGAIDWANQTYGSVKVVPGALAFQMPAQTTVGVRHRVNQVMTWEADVRFIQGTRLEVPTLPGIQTTDGTAQVAIGSKGTKNAMSLGGMTELTLSKRWTVRVGFCLEGGVREEEEVEHLYGLGRNASFSGGFSWQGLGGVVSFGYQFRQAQDTQTKKLDGKWPSSGYQPVPTDVRVEGQGHLWSLGYKFTF